MTDTLLQAWPYLLAAAVAGGVLGGLLRAGADKRGLMKLSDEWQLKFDEAARQRDRFNAENTKLRTTIEAQQAVVHRHELAAKNSRTELESVREKSNSLNKELFAASAERDELMKRVTTASNALNAAKQQFSELEAEFVKAGAFYKGELEKAFDKRKSLELKIDDAKLEQESLQNQLESARAEHASVNNMLTSAKSRLDNLDAMEQKVIALDAENAQMRHDAALAIQEIESLRRDVAELDELKIQNKELAHCLDSIENSRKQYERDAQRYRDQASHSEKKSETLAMKLDDVEKSFAEMEKQHQKAVKKARKQTVSAPSNGKDSEAPEVDDLTEIIGIGKAFQQILHKLGVVNFRQIAAFGPADVARVNQELKEYKGRMEQDDWIGQAKELHFKKYGHKSH